MKWLITTLLLPGLAFAQQPAPAGGQPIDPQQRFEMSKKLMLPVIEKSLPALEETQQCLQQAGDAGSFQKCVAIMNDLEKQMRQELGSAQGTPPGAPAQEQPAPKPIEYNEQNKSNMLKFLSQSIAAGQAMKQCFSTSATGEQMDSCMKAAKAKQP
ncbi:MAG: hypothetical protein ABW076_02300 [Candidatus Thiodiazotropha sp.]